MKRLQQESPGKTEQTDMPEQENTMSFWDHLDVLRAALLKILAVTLVFGMLAFLFKDTLFAIILAPKSSDFIVYRVFHAVAVRFGSGMPAGDFTVDLINTGLARQFIIHMKAAMYVGFLFASPYALFQLFRFISPALYVDERKYVVRVAGCGYFMFVLGVLFCYFLLFPLTFRFLGTYQVSGEVRNLISLDSYMGTLITMSLFMGAVFEIPVLCWLFARLGFLTVAFMRRYRKHAVVAILTLAAVITPTADIFTLSLVSLPMWLLYELSILIVKRAEHKKECA